jgi:hypothetical protein
MLLGALVLFSGRPSSAGEVHFDRLEIGTKTYTNVTLTSRTENYIFVLHEGGMGNIKVSELPPDLRRKLGYAPPPPVKQPRTNSVAGWAKEAKETMAKIQPAQMQQFEAVVRSKLPVSPESIIKKGPAFVLGFLGGLLVVYLFFSYCLMLICKKAGTEPGGIVWLPLLQLIPMLRAAGMSGVWFFAFFIPVLNLLAHIVWSVKIVQVRGKSIIVAVLLILPISSLFAFLYLAFSDGEKPKKKEPRPTQIMTLEAA